MPMLTGLPGVRANMVHAIFFFSSDKVEEILNSDQAATTAGDEGAINIYKDDNGFVRCEIMRYCRTVESKKFKKMASVLNWADKWLPQIGIRVESEDLFTIKRGLHK